MAAVWSNLYDVAREFTGLIKTQVGIIDIGSVLRLAMYLQRYIMRDSVHASTELRTNSVKLSCVWFEEKLGRCTHRNLMILLASVTNRASPLDRSGSLGHSILRTSIDDIATLERAPFLC
jgi:hypothetical protein